MAHVLIVEDHEENRDLLKLLLEVNGYRVTAAGNGLEALEAARRDRPDAVVSDALMPKMDGFALCRAWMQDAALKSIPFIFYSATYVRPEDEQFANALGAVRYLIKPLEAAAFLRELRAVLQQWAGQAAPPPSVPLAESAARALHESALERKLEDKIAQLEAANRRLREGEERLRGMTEMSSDFFWESDAEHRLTQRSSAAKKSSAISLFERGAHIGERRWEIPYLSPDAIGWAAHRKVLDAHRPFRQFELSRLGTDGTEHFISISGDPVFDATGAFRGYRGVGTDITERRRAEKALRESEARLRAMFEGVLDGILVVDINTRKFLTGNPEICRMLGYALEDLAGMGPPDIHRKQDQLHVAEQFAKLLRGETQLNSEVPVMRKDGSVFYADIKAAHIRFDGKDAMLGMFRDVSERKAAETKIHRLTQLYAALSHCNEAIVRCTSDAELFAQICRDAVEHGGMKMAWIGLLDPAAKSVRPAASFGERDSEYLRDIKLSVDADSPYGRGPVGTAMRDNAPAWFQDFQHDPRAAAWHERSRDFGWRSVAALPLCRNGIPVGVLVLYAGEAGAFDDPARKLVIEMATDIGFALDNFAREAARQQAEKELRAAEEQFRGLVEQSIAGIFIIQDGKFVYANPRAAEIVAQGTTTDLIDAQPMHWIVEADRDKVAESMRRLLAGETQSSALDFGVVRRDGVVIQVGANAARATRKGRPAIIGLLQDISEKTRAEAQIQQYVEQLRTAFMSTVEVATAMGEMRDPYTAGHQRRVAGIAVAIGAELGLDERRQEGLRVAGYLHDVGKITLPAEILSKPGKLSAIEFQLIQGHSRSGYDVLKNVQFPWPVAEVALQHHERVDGSGYPQGLKGEAILLEARIMAVADVMEAMSSHRPYRPGLGIDKALAEIERGRGSAYDADVADACLRMFREQAYQMTE